jgi:hypothetical protein
VCSILSISKDGPPAHSFVVVCSYLAQPYPHTLRTIASVGVLKRGRQKRLREGAAYLAYTVFFFPEKRKNEKTMLIYISANEMECIDVCKKGT